jgi:hypothetical protein
LIDVRKLSPLTEAECFMELMENDKHEWTDQHIGNVLRNLPKTMSGNIDVTRPPKYRGVPLEPYRTGSGEQHNLFDDALSEQL